MTTFSLLQQSLGQTISRQALEEASVLVPSVARADCVGMQRDLFGILVSGLPLEDARAFQAQLQVRGFPTDLVPDRDVPRLHPPFTIQRVELDKDFLVFTDAMGRVQKRPRVELVFMAGGFLNKIEFRSERNLNVTFGLGRAPEHELMMERRSWEEQVQEFRLDFFFSGLPNRVVGTVSEESVLFFRGRVLRLRERVLLLGAMMDCCELLPPERIGQGLQRRDTEMEYPSLRGYEEEIRWHFHQLIARG